jgi:hypothetical protein
MRGEKVKAGWVNESDFERSRLNERARIQGLKAVALKRIANH